MIHSGFHEKLGMGPNNRSILLRLFVGYTPTGRPGGGGYNPY